MVRHRRWYTGAAFGLLVVGLVFLTGAVRAGQRVRILHPSAVSQTYGGACWKDVTVVCEKPGKICGEYTCTFDPMWGGGAWKCDSNATDEQQNWAGWYNCVNATSGHVDCYFLATSYCVKVYPCTAAGQWHACKVVGDKGWCAGTPYGTPTFKYPHDEYYVDTSSLKCSVQ